jgi:heme-degrading monooxygenase HmoA
MVGAQCQLAQINVARMRAPLTDPVMAAFVTNLKPINELADASPGFVWRFQTEEGDATAVRPYDDDRIIINLSVWESLEALRGFVYAVAHNVVMKRRREWFERLTDTYVALWWVLRDHRPPIAEAVARLEYLKRHGSSPVAFTFREPFPEAVTNYNPLAGHCELRVT